MTEVGRYRPTPGSSATAVTRLSGDASTPGAAAICPRGRGAPHQAARRCGPGGRRSAPARRVQQRAPQGIGLVLPGLPDDCCALQGGQVSGDSGGAVSRPWSSAADRAIASPPPRPEPLGGQVVVLMGRFSLARRSAFLTTCGTSREPRSPPPRFPMRRHRPRDRLPSLPIGPKSSERRLSAITATTPSTVRLPPRCRRRHRSRSRRGRRRQRS